MEAPTTTRTITLQELQYILQKMKQFDLQEGYVGEVKGKLELFILPCHKAPDLITRKEIEQSIKDYEKQEVE